MQHLTVVKFSILGQILCNQILEEYSEDSNTYSTLCSALSVPNVPRGCVVYEKFWLWILISTFCPQANNVAWSSPGSIFKNLLVPKVSKNAVGWKVAQKRISVQPISIFQVIKSVICIAALRWIWELQTDVIFSITIKFRSTTYIYSVFQLPVCTKSIQTQHCPTGNSLINKPKMLKTRFRHSEI